MQVLNAYPDGIRNGHPVEDESFSRHSSRQGGMRHAVASMQRGRMSVNELLNLCGHTNAMITFIHYCLEEAVRFNIID
jgi:hypothetical protein